MTKQIISFEQALAAVHASQGIKPIKVVYKPSKDSVTVYRVQDSYDAFVAGIDKDLYAGIDFGYAKYPDDEDFDAQELMDDRNSGYDH